MDLVKFADKHPEWINKVHHPDYPNLVKFNYRHKAIYDGAWTTEVEHSRGIVLDTDTDEIVVHPFNKFYNLGEKLQQEDLPTDETFWVVEKLDGVLIIPFLYDAKIFVTTRGSFDNEFTRVVDKGPMKILLSGLDYEHYSHMFELIHPVAHIVTDYGTQERLVLIGLRDKEGNMCDPEMVEQYAEAHELECYKVFEPHPLDTIVEWKEAESENIEEGWVVQFNSGLVVKVKRDEYVELVRLAKKVSVKHIIDLLAENKFEEFRSKLPEEVVERADMISFAILAVHDEYMIDANNAYEAVSGHGWDQKTQALEVLAHHKEWSAMIFARRDGKDVAPYVWKKIKRERLELFGNILQEEDLE